MAAQLAAGAAGALAVAGRVASAIPIVGQIAEGAKNSLPHLEDEVTVEVVGQPGAKRKDLYYLALAAACGVVRRFDIAQWVAPPPGLLMVEYSIGTGAEDHHVRVTLRYRTSLLTSAIAGAVENAALNIAAQVGQFFGGEDAERLAAYTAQRKSLPMYSEAPLFAGPKDEVVGAPFNFTGALIPGLPTSSESEGAPQLPFAGRTILTKRDVCINPDPAILAGGAGVVPAWNPKPAGDGRSRGKVQVTKPGTAIGANVVDDLLVPLVYAAIANPGSPLQQVYPPPTPGPTGG